MSFVPDHRAARMHIIEHRSFIFFSLLAVLTWRDQGCILPRTYAVAVVSFGTGMGDALDRHVLTELSLLRLRLQRCIGAVCWRSAVCRCACVRRPWCGGAESRDDSQQFTVRQLPWHHHTCKTCDSSTAPDAGPHAHGTSTTLVPRGIGRESCEPTTTTAV